jgi:hypothetical protein
MILQPVPSDAVAGLLCSPLENGRTIGGLVLRRLFFLLPRKNDLCYTIPVWELKYRHLNQNLGQKTHRTVARRL